MHTDTVESRNTIERLLTLYEEGEWQIGEELLKQLERSPSPELLRRFLAASPRCEVIVDYEFGPEVGAQELLRSVAERKASRVREGDTRAGVWVGMGARVEKTRVAVTDARLVWAGHSITSDRAAVWSDGALGLDWRALPRCLSDLLGAPAGLPIIHAISGGDSSPSREDVLALLEIEDLLDSEERAFGPAPARGYAPPTLTTYRCRMRDGSVRTWRTEVVSYSEGYMGRLLYDEQAPHIEIDIEQLARAVGARSVHSVIIEACDKLEERGLEPGQVTAACRARVQPTGSIWVQARDGRWHDVWHYRVGRAGWGVWERATETALEAPVTDAAWVERTDQEIELIRAQRCEVWADTKRVYFEAIEAGALEVQIPEDVKHRDRRGRAILVGSVDPDDDVHWMSAEREVEHIPGLYERAFALVLERVRQGDAR